MNIFVRSPYIITVDEVGQDGSKVELFIYNGSTAPTTPTRTLSSQVASLSQVANYYDISPYVREYISFEDVDTTTTASALDTQRYANVTVKRYTLSGGEYTLLDTADYVAFDGWLNYEFGMNAEFKYGLLDELKYTYNPNVFLGNFVYNKIVGSNIVRYTNLVTGTVVNMTSPPIGTPYTYPCVYPSWEAQGNKIQITGTLGIKHTMYFTPQEECRYIPVTIDFVNRFGALQRVFFFKASTSNIDVTNKDYSLLSQAIDYNPSVGTYRQFNANGREKITCNSGWVDEEFNTIIQQIMLSERIFVNEKPAICNTKSMELQKNINNKTINYVLEFSFANDIINNVI